MSPLDDKNYFALIRTTYLCWLLLENACVIFACFHDFSCHGCARRCGCKDLKIVISPPILCINVHYTVLQASGSSHWNCFWMQSPFKFYFHDLRSQVLERQYLPHILQDRMLVSAKYAKLHFIMYVKHILYFSRSLSLTDTHSLDLTLHTWKHTH